MAFGLNLPAATLSRAHSHMSLSENRGTLLLRIFGTPLPYGFSTMVLVDKNSLVIFHAVSGEMIKLNRTAAFPYSVTDKMTSNFQ